MKGPMAPTRPARLLAPLAVLLLALALCASALGSATGPHGSSARSRSTKTARHGRKRHVVRHHARRRAAHKTKKAARHSSAAPAVELVPAACEDSSAPSHSGGGEYSCEDGSAPACEEGTLRTADSAPPMCAVKAAPEGECARGGGECGDVVEFDCEEAEGEDSPGSCEGPAGGEVSEEEESG